MIGREKVIKTLDTQIAIAKEIRSDFVQLTVGEAKTALELLKEQESVQVIQREAMNMLFWCCGYCGVAITEGDKFCRMCGKAVKWDNEKENHTNS